MRKSNYVMGGITAVCIITLLLSGVSARVCSSAPAFSPLWGPYLTNATETSIAVHWRTEETTEGAVQYATEDYFLDELMYSDSVSDSARELHSVVLTGLSPDTTYHYRLQAGGEYTADHTFTTFGSEDFTFIVYGDTQDNAPWHKLVADRIAAEEDVSFVIHTGDLVNDGDDLEEWDRFFEAAGEMLADTPIYPVLGNHEYDSPNYYDAFGVPLCYSFDCANAHFCMLDSNQTSDLGAEAEWLAEDADCDADWKFAAFHHPSYTSSTHNWGGYANTRQCWEQIFIDNGVNAVFNGHVHAYERYWGKGIHYVVLGTGGSPTYILSEYKIDGYRSSLESILGYARVTVSGDEAVMEIVRVADVSEDNSEILRVYPPNTVYQRVSLSHERSTAGASLSVTTELMLPSVGIAVDPQSVDYGAIKPGEASLEKVLEVFNIGTVDVHVTLEVQGENALAQDFHEQCLYVNGAAYDPEEVLCSISVDGSEEIATQLQVPSTWSDLGAQRATLIFWAEALE